MRRYVFVRLFFWLSVMICLNLPTFSTYATTTYSCSDGLHEYESELLTINTEDHEGEVRNTCVLCGDTYIEVLPATGHTFTEWEVIQPATETSTGIETRHCVGCGRAYRRTLPMIHIDIFQPEPEWEANSLDYMLVGSISGIWVYTFLMLWYNGLVINWDKRERLKRRKIKENSYERK